MLRFFIICLFICCNACAADDPYELWGHGRPGDAIAELHTRATTTQRWDSWLDLGLAAAAAEREADAIAWLLRAHVLAPDRPEPLQALAALDHTPPPGWLQRLGPLAWPGLGWIGVIILGLGAALIGFGCCTPRSRGLILGLGVVLIIIALPGRLAYEHDHGRPLLSTVRDTVLLDSAGRPVCDVTAGTIVIAGSPETWGGRILVQLSDGKRGYLPEIDIHPQP